MLNRRFRELVHLVRERETAFRQTVGRGPSPYEMRRDFRVPLFCVREKDLVFELDSTMLLEHPWRLSEKDASLSDKFNPLVRPAGRQGVLDVGAAGQVIAGVLDEATAGDFVGALHQQVLAWGRQPEWTIEALVAWLDRRIDHRDIPVGESAAFLTKVIRGLMMRYAMPDVSACALDRFRLRDEIENRIDQHRRKERVTAFQRFLLPDAPVVASDEYAINFRDQQYEPSWLYEGGVVFTKHYFGPKPGELRERTPSGATTEEFKCAQFTDSMPEVAFWVRNLARRSGSFRLQTSTDWFYPDLCASCATAAH